MIFLYIAIVLFSYHKYSEKNDFFAFSKFFSNFAPDFMEYMNSFSQIAVIRKITLTRNATPLSRPSGRTDILFGKTNISFGKTNILFGKTNILFGKTNIPFGKTNIPFGKTNIPFGKTNIPFGKTDIPFGKTDIPFGKTNNRPLLSFHYTISSILLTSKTVCYAQC
jgi:hypothetical protein